jgi:hypothetical protein
VRIAFTSDVHADVSPRNGQLLPHLARRVEALAPDVLVLAGETANSLAALERTLTAFAGVRARKLLVPGKHDVWIESRNALRKGRDSWHKYVTAIPEACARRRVECLVGAPVTIGGVGFAGSIGWYDYSLRDPRLGGRVVLAEYERGRFQDASGQVGIWNDVEYAVWLASPGAADWRLWARRLANRDVFDRVRGAPRRRPGAARRGPGHRRRPPQAPFAECLVRKDPPDPFDAYEGSVALDGSAEPLEEVAARSVGVLEVREASTG